MKPGVWREVSVSGEMFGLRHCRSAKHRGKTVSYPASILNLAMITLTDFRIFHIFPLNKNHTQVLMIWIFLNQNERIPLVYFWLNIISNLQNPFMSFRNDLYVAFERCLRFLKLKMIKINDPGKGFKTLKIYLTMYCLVKY